MSILLKKSLSKYGKIKLFGLILSLGVIHFYPHKAFAFSPGVSLSYGTGKPDDVKGFRIALQNFWPFLGFAGSSLNLTGYWDFSLADWRSSPPLASQPHHISIVAASPVLRLQTQAACFLWAQPYLELGIGASFLSNNHFGHRNLGGQFAFQDLLGLGLRWKSNDVWSLSYHYLHYSNAGLLPPNQGIDVKHLFSLGYAFN